MKLRKKGFYFDRSDSEPAPVVVEGKRRVHFSEVDAMGIVWYGRYPLFFEEGAEELGRYCGLSYKDFYEAELRTPIVQCHIDYFAPLHLDEEFSIKTLLIWNEAARLDTEYYLIKDNGKIAVSGYTVQLIIDLKGEVCLVFPPVLEKCRRRWKTGEFLCLVKKQ